ncbi:MAG: hypothetical protein ACRDG3_04025 [Tepidiformaceae bacterium]
MSLFRKVETKIRDAQAAHSERSAEHDAYTAAVLKLAQPEGDVATLLATLPPLPPAMNPGDATALKLQACHQLADALLGDERLTSAEETHLLAVGTGLGITMDALAAHDPTLIPKLVIAKANDGRPPVLDAADVRLILKKGEVAHQTANATLLKEQTTREFRGGSRGLSFRIAKGVYYRTGQFKGHSVVTGTTVAPTDSGVLTVTSQRVVFSGDKSSLEFAYAKLLDITGYSDGVKLAVSNRQKPSTFHIEPGADVVNAVLHAAVRKSQSG